MKKQKCNRCLQPRLKTQFAFKDKATGRRHAICKLCHSEFRKDYYKKNTEQEKANAVRRTEMVRDRLFALMVRAKLIPCVACGDEQPPWVMHFDHLDGAIKEDNVASLVHRAISDKRFLAEIEKCDVVCANCHAKRTFNRRAAKGSLGRYEKLRSLIEKYLGV